jgi:tetratricopeptide (TPR) repeat protein
MHCNPNPFNILFNKALWYEGMAAYTPAVKCYTEALVFSDSRVPMALLRRAYCLAKLGRYQDALMDALRAERQMPDFYYLHLVKAECYERLGKKHDALVGFTNALKLAPDHHKARARRASIYFDLGLAQFAVDDLTVLIDNDFEVSTSRHLRGRCHELLGNFAEALMDHVQTMNS